MIIINSMIWRSTDFLKISKCLNLRVLRHVIDFIYKSVVVCSVSGVNNTLGLFLSERGWKKSGNNLKVTCVSKSVQYFFYLCWWCIWSIFRIIICRPEPVVNEIWLSSFFFCYHCLVVHSIQLKSAIFLISISPLWSNYIIVPFFVWSNPTAINYWRLEIQTDRQNPIHKVWLNLETVSTIEKQRPPSRWELND